MYLKYNASPIFAWFPIDCMFSMLDVAWAPQIDGTPLAYKPLVDSFYLGTHLSTDVNYLEGSNHKLQCNNITYIILGNVRFIHSFFFHDEYYPDKN